MKAEIPESENPLIIRTDFSDDAAWQEILSALQQPEDSWFMFNMEVIEVPQLAGATAETLVAAVPEQYPHPMLVLADSVAMTEPDHPLLVVDLEQKRGTVLRAIPSQIAPIENNLTVGNMGFHEYADSTGEDGIFRGYEEG